MSSSLEHTPSYNGLTLDSDDTKQLALFLSSNDNLNNNHKILLADLLILCFGRKTLARLLLSDAILQNINKNIPPEKNLEVQFNDKESDKSLIILSWLKPRDHENIKLTEALKSHFTPINQSHPQRSKIQKLSPNLTKCSFNKSNSTVKSREPQGQEVIETSPIKVLFI